MNDLPTDWPVRRLCDVVSLPSGQVNPMRLPYSEQILIAPDHVESGTGRLLELRTAADQGASSGKYIVKPGDVVYSKIRPALRKAVITEFEGLCSADMYPMSPSEEIESRYLLTILLSEQFSRFAESVSGRSGIPKINRSELEEFSVPLPPIEEQRRIVEVLDSAEQKIRVEGQALAKLEIMYDGALAEFMTLGTKNVASAWDLTSCSKAFIMASGLPYSQAKPDSGGSVPIYGSSGLAGYGCLSLSSQPTFVIGRVGEGGVGSTYYLDQPSWITDNALWAKWIDPDWLPEFIALYLSWFNLRRFRSQTGQPLITRKVIGECPLVKPSLEEQHEIVQILHEWTSRHLRIEQNIAKLRLLKRGLMNDLLTGRVRVPER